MQLQEMRNVVFGFPEVEESRGEERRRRAGAKSVSWGDEGPTGGAKGREGAEGGGRRPRPIIKRSASLPTRGAAVPSDADGLADEALAFGAHLPPAEERQAEERPARRRPAVAAARTKSPRPDGSFARCPVHSLAGEGSPRAERHPADDDDRSDEGSSGEEFEERACRALSDFLVEATSLLEGLCRASGLSPEGERRKKDEDQELCSAEGEGKSESPLDAKEVLAALQTRLSDRHLMRSPPKNTRDAPEERNPTSLLHSPPYGNPIPSATLPPTFESRFSSLYSSLAPRGDTRFGVNNSRECTQTAIPPVHLGLPQNIETRAACGVGDSTYVGDEEVSKTSSVTMPSGAESKCKMKVYTELHGAGATSGLSEFRQTDSSMGTSLKARLPEFPIRNCSSGLLNNPAPTAPGMRRSESEGLVATKMGTLNRPSSPDLFPDFGRPPRISGRGEDGSGASLFSNWSPRVPWRDENESDDRDLLLHERAWRSSNALYVPPPQHPAPLRESQSDAALCSAKTLGGCCLHGHGHQEKRVHHHHHHYHHYPPFVEPDYKQKWESMVKRLSWSEQDEEEESFNLWRGSAPQLSSQNPQSLGSYDYVRAWQHDSLKVDPLRGVASRGRELHRGEGDCHTPFSSAPTSPYRSKQPSPPGSLPLSPTHQQQRNSSNHPLHAGLLPNPSNVTSPFLSTHHGGGGDNPLAHSLSDSLPHHSLSRPLNLPPPTHTPPLLRSATHPIPNSPRTHPPNPSPSHSHTFSHHPPPPARFIPTPMLSSSGYQTSHGPNNGSKFPSSPVQQSSSQFPPLRPYLPYQHGRVSPPHRPQPGNRSSIPSHSPTFAVPPTDLSWHDGSPHTIGSGLAPHAYLRHLVDVRKEVVAATRSCNPHTQSSTSSHLT